MKSFFLITIVLLLILPGCRKSIVKSDEAFIDSLMNATYKPDAPGAVLLVAKDGKPIYKKAFGLANVELSIPNKTDYLFQIGSMSKQFTAVCILQLAQEGKLSLQDDIRKYLSNYNTHGRVITIENLLTHTSGIPSNTEKQGWANLQRNDISMDDGISYFMNDSLLFEPGTNWSYSNSGYVLAGIIVEKVSGLSLEEYLQKYILDPLCMTNTFVISNQKIIKNAASGYITAGKNKFRPQDYSSPTWFYGAGYIMSNLDDLVKWNNALSTNVLLKTEWLEKAWTSFKLNDGTDTHYGLGWWMDEINNVRIIEHAGGMPGYTSDCIRIPSKNLFVLILNNMAFYNPFVISPIAFKLSGLPYKKEMNIFKLDRKILENYTGSYKIRMLWGRLVKNFGNIELYRTFKIRNDTLIEQVTGDYESSLLPVREDTFIKKGIRDLIYHFVRNESGKISSLEISEQIATGPVEIENKTDKVLNIEKLKVSVEAKQIESYKGKYDMGGGYYLQVALEGTKIYVYITGEDKEEIKPENETKFYFTKRDATLEFIKDKAGKVTGLVLSPLLSQIDKPTARKIE
jgi:CubicO group peptidase (beta-lactamase class C family)